MAKGSGSVPKKAGKGTVLKTCKCQSGYQDCKYGLCVRVMNLKADGSATCTVCGSVVR